MRKDRSIEELVLYYVVALAVALLIILLFTGCSAMTIPEIDHSYKYSAQIVEDELNPAIAWNFWTKGPIRDLLLKNEKKILKKILSDKIEVRKKRNLKRFDEWFWAKRDDNPYDNENEFRNSFYNRVLEAETRFASKNGVKKRSQRRYKGWRSPMGRIYIALGEPFDSARYDLGEFVGLGTTSEISREVEEIEVWYYDLPEDFSGFWFTDVAWLLFEKDNFGRWDWARKFLNFASYRTMYTIYRYPSYSQYVLEIERFLKAKAKENIYNSEVELKLENK